MKIELPKCPVETTITIIGSKWNLLIIRDLLTGTKRFGELRKSLGVSQKVLTQNLRNMEAKKLINRKVFAQVPLKVEYSLTELGWSLKDIYDELWSWGEKYQQNFK